MIPFTEKDRQSLKQILQDSLSINDDTIADDILSTVEQTGYLRAFAFGSLINEPHTDDITQQYRAHIPNWKRAFCVQDVYYRGTPEKPGIALGLIRGDDCASTPGEILETQLDPHDMPTTLSRARHWITRFGQRENPKISNLYKFEMIEAVCDKNNTIRSIACIADTESPYYIPEDFSLENKAAIMACSYGPTYRKRPSRTSMQYLRDTINDCRNSNLSLEDEFLELLAIAHKVREHMPADKKQYLERLEMDKGYADDLYELCSEHDITNGKCGLQTAHSAWEQLGTLKQ